MDGVLEFVAKLNIERFISRLEIELDGTIRSSLSELLIVEIDKLDPVSEQLATVDVHCAGVGQYIREQQREVDGLEQDGRESNTAHRLLKNGEELQQLLRAHRTIILRRLAEG